MSNKPNILLVDDDTRFVTSLQNILEHDGYNCTKVMTGADAMAQLQSRSYELALLDVELPDMSGCEIASFIKKSNLKTSAIMLTGVKTVETAVKAMKLGAYDFLNKPLDHDLLQKTLKKALRQNQLEQELEDSEVKFKVLSEAAWEGIVIHENGNFVDANKPFWEMFGYSRKDSRREIRLENLLTPETQKRIELCRNTTCIGSGKRRDGKELPIEAKSRSILYRNRPMEVLIIRDLTERQRAEQEKLELEKKLSAAKRLNALGLMAGSVAHDLNNILSGIVSYPDLLLLQMDESDQYYEKIQKIQAAGKRAAAVVSDLVAITRGRVQEKNILKINELVHNYLNSLEHNERLTAYPDVVIKTTLQKDIWNSCCSSQHIHKLLLNLIGNALEAVGEKGIIDVSTENCRFTHPLNPRVNRGNGDQYVKLKIADNGPGIEDKDLDHIFDPFYSTKVMGKSGTGLGLSVVWNIVQEHDGWIEVKDNCPGAVFEIYLPATHDVTCPVDLAPRKIVNEGCGEKILIVDDQEEQNEVLESSLKRIGYSTSSVTSGEEAIRYLRSYSVDLIVMDMIMGSGLNGRETLEIIMQDHPEQKAIVLSGYAKREDIEKTKKLGVSVFLEKPATLLKISEAVRYSLNSQ